MALKSHTFSKLVMLERTVADLWPNLRQILVGYMWKWWLHLREIIIKKSMGEGQV